MWLLRRLQNALRGLESAGALSAQVKELRERVEALDRLQVERELEWQEARDAIYRNLKRAQALKQRSGDEDDGFQRAQALARTLKFPNSGA